jgi:hypothetical protein
MGLPSIPERSPTAASTFEASDGDWQGESDEDEAVGFSSKSVLDGKFYDSPQTLASDVRSFCD